MNWGSFDVPAVLKKFHNNISIQFLYSSEMSDKNNRKMHDS